MYNNDNDDDDDDYDDGPTLAGVESSMYELGKIVILIHGVVETRHRFNCIVQNHWLFGIFQLQAMAIDISLSVDMDTCQQLRDGGRLPPEAVKNIPI